MPPRRRPLFGWGRERPSLVFYNVGHSSARYDQRKRWKFFGLAALLTLMIVHQWRGDSSSDPIGASTLYNPTLNYGSIPSTACRLDPPWGGTTMPNHDNNVAAQPRESENCSGPHPSHSSTTAVRLTCPSDDDKAHSMPSSTSTVHPRIAVVLLYYASPAMLLRQLHHYAHDLLENDPSLQQSLTLLIVDDGSPLGLRADDYINNENPPHHPQRQSDGTTVGVEDYYKMIPNLHLVQIDTDLPWNQPGARNLAMHLLGTLYGPDLMVIVLDLDLLLPLSVLQSILSGTETSSSSSSSSSPMMAHTFNRTRQDGLTYKEHPSAMALTVQDWWRGAGGMDEDFTGHYGSDDSAFWWKWQATVTDPTTQQESQQQPPQTERGGNNNHLNDQRRQTLFHSDWILQEYKLEKGECDATWIPNIVQQQRCEQAKQQQQQKQHKPKNSDIRDDNLNLVKLKRKRKSGCWSSTYLRFPWHYVPRR